MLKYSFFIRLALCLLAFCYGTLGLSAEHRLITSFTDGNLQVTGKDGNYHALPNAGTATFSLTFDETDSICDNTIQVTFYIKRDGTDVKCDDIPCAVSKGIITDLINFSEFSSFDTPGEYKMSCEIAYWKKPFGENVDSTQVADTLYADKTITIYDLPEVEIVSPTEYVELHNTEITTTPLELKGGYGEGWKFVWYESNNEVQLGELISNQNDSSIKNYPVTNDTDDVKTIYLNVVVTNTAPDGTTLWYTEQQKQYKITIYPTPEADFTPTDEKLDILDEEKVSLECIISPNNLYLWEFDWGCTGDGGSGDNSNNINIYEFTGVNDGPDGKKTSTITATVTYAKDQDEPIKHVFPKTTTINVWPIPQILYPAPNNTDTIYVYDGQTIELSGNKQGGYTDSNNAWTFKWSIDNGKTTTHPTTYNKFESPQVTFHNEGNVPKNVDCEVTITNTCNGKEWLSETRNFPVKIFPHMSLEVERVVTCKKGEDILPDDDNITFNNDTIKCYDGDKITLTATAEGGRAGKWHYEWDKNSEESPIYTETVTRQGNNPLVMTLNIKAKNEYQDGDFTPPLEKTYTVKVYSRGNVTPAPLDSILVDDRHHYLNGSGIKMKSTRSGGYDAGWDYTWKEGSSDISGKKDKDCTLNAYNPGNTYVDKTYKLIAVNKIGKNEGYNEEFEYDSIRIWPSIQFHTEINCDKAYILENKKVREGDEFTLSVTKATGGYQPTENYADNFKYKWRNEDSKNESYYYEENSKVGNKKSATREKDYFVEIWQKGPYGNEWGRTVSSNMIIKFYPCPQIPVSVVRKGNGTTQTLIVMNGTDDDNNGNNPMIVNDDYTYRFGYTDSGQDYLSKPKTKRWFRLNPDYFEGTSAPDFNSADARLWAIAEWQYDDGVTVTSGRVFVDKQKDSEPYFNASSFFYEGNVSSQAPRFLPFHEGKDVDGINTITENGGSISIVGDMLMINFDSPTDATINIYNLSGSCLKTINVYGQSSVNEPLNLNNLSKGIYLVETLTNGIRDIKKIIIR